MNKLRAELDNIKSNNSKKDEQYDESDFSEMDSEIQIIQKKGFQQTSPQSAPEAHFKCTICGKVLISEVDLNGHVKTHDPPECDICVAVFNTWYELKKHKSESHQENKQIFNCNDCDFQATSGPILKKHINIMHHEKANNVDSALGDTLKCRVCGEEFSEWWNLMHHRRDSHPEKRRQCKNYLENRCQYTDKECWWSHEEVQKKRGEITERVVNNVMFVNKNLKQLHK